jgi:DNA-binding response OmpR family regulator
MTKNRFEAVLTTFLTGQGYQVAEAESGPLALAQLEIFHPDIILLDIRMPGMDGLQTLQKFKARDSEVLVIMVTATTDDDIAQETIQLGACDYIIKPFSFEQLQTHLAVRLLMG